MNNSFHNKQCPYIRIEETNVKNNYFITETYILNGNLYISSIWTYGICEPWEIGQILGGN